MHRVTSRVLVGQELCRNEDYIRSSMAFTDSIFINGLVLSMVPFGCLRILGSNICSYFHRRKLEKALGPVIPVVQQRLLALETSPSQHLDALDWTIELSRAYHQEYKPRRIALQLLHNLWAGSAAPAGLVIQILFQILLKPGYLTPLLNEIVDAISTYGYTEKGFNSMLLLDSFVREINRLYPTGSSQSKDLDQHSPTKVRFS